MSYPTGLLSLEVNKKTVLKKILCIGERVENDHTFYQETSFGTFSNSIKNYKQNLFHKNL